MRSSMKAPAVNVDDYLAIVPEDARAALEKLRRTIRAAAPKADECISYGMPAYKYHGPLVYFAAFKDHCSFFPGGLVEKFKSDLKGYPISKGTIRFSVDKPLPATLVKKIVKARIAQNLEREVQRAKR